jgi:A/G-specific adenine glycosylase
LTAPDSIASRVIEWQARYGRRGLPWLGSRDPYRVWLSEVMLQQTQVVTVLTYYDRFLARFPDVRALAAASLDEVLALWRGFGYYSRARNLWRCAQVVVEHHGGRFPVSAAELETLPGIGRSTAAAIAAFCFGERAAILDGNVKRVLARVLGFSDDLASSPAQQRLWALAESLLPHQGIEAYTQGLMDLGASVCSVRDPKCLVCPLEAVCEGRRLGDPTRFPVKSRRLKRSERFSAWLWLEHRDRWWLTRRPDDGVWAGLWSLPEFSDLASALAHLGSHQPHAKTLPSLHHALTHFDWTLQPVRCALPGRLSARSLASLTQPLGPGAWLTAAEARALGLPAPLRKLLDAA